MRQQMPLQPQQQTQPRMPQPMPTRQPLQLRSNRYRRASPNTLPPSLSMATMGLDAGAPGANCERELQNLVNVRVCLLGKMNLRHSVRISGSCPVEYEFGPYVLPVFLDGPFLRSSAQFPHQVRLSVKPASFPRGLRARHLRRSRIAQHGHALRQTLEDLRVALSLLPCGTVERFQSMFVPNII